MNAEIKYYRDRKQQDGGDCFAEEKTIWISRKKEDVENICKNYRSSLQ